MSVKDEEDEITKEEMRHLLQNLTISISSTIRLRHRVCIDCYSSDVNSISNKNIEEIRCGKCGSIQPL